MIQHRVQQIVFLTSHVQEYSSKHIQIAKFKKHHVEQMIILKIMHFVNIEIKIMHFVNIEIRASTRRLIL